jgi:hypothetical protein
MVFVPDYATDGDGKARDEGFEGTYCMAMGTDLLIGRFVS